MMGKGQGPVQAQANCSGTYVVFDFAYDAPPQQPVDAVRVLAANNVYKCARVLAAENTDRETTHTEHDYAVLELDRAVEMTEPLPVRGGPAIALGEPMIQIGHPAGIPQRSHPPRFARRIDGRPYNGFAYDGDLFSATRAAVYSRARVRADRNAIGINNGEDFVYDEARRCFVVGVCGVNTTCTSLAGAYDTVTMLSADHRRDAESAPDDHDAVSGFGCVTVFGCDGW
jgi:hypothetical protein